MAQTLKVALIQSELVWEDPEQNRLEFEKKIMELPSDTELVVLPEMFTTGFTMTPKNIAAVEAANTIAWMRAMARQRKMAIMGSISCPVNHEYTNRLFFIKPGEDPLEYDKRHTFTFAGEDKVYKAGRDRLIVAYKDFRICPLICYDLRFPVWARNTENYDVLIYVANWPKPRIAAWNALLKARAIENLAYCIGVNRVGTDPNSNEYPGHSAVYDCLGEQLTFSKDPGTLYATLSKQHLQATRQKLNFLTDRDHFSLEV